jgi:hypothetical protein
MKTTIDDPPSFDFSKKDGISPDAVTNDTSQQLSQPVKHQTKKEKQIEKRQSFLESEPLLSIIVSSTVAQVLFQNWDQVRKGSPSQVPGV